MLALLDVNVLIALLDENHTQNANASAWFEGNVDSGWASCPLTQNGCIRIIAQPGYPNAISLTDALSRLQRAVSTPYHRFIPDDISLLDDAVVDRRHLLGHNSRTSIFSPWPPRTMLVWSRSTSLSLYPPYGVRTWTRFSSSESMAPVPWEIRMDFVGRLNFANPVSHDHGTEEQRRAFAAGRLGRPTPIRDARALYGVMPEPSDSAALLADGRGFLLVHAPSAVTDWTDIEEVAAVYYEESRALLQKLLPDAVVPPTRSHTFRNEQIKDHYWENGIQYGPCAAAVHNDYADSLSADRSTVTEKFTEIQGMPTDRRVLGINIWRSVSPQPLARFPLAVCDRTSIDRDDLEYDLNPNAKPRPFNAHYCKPNDAQRWYYYATMTRDEALVFTTYDSHPADGEVFCPTLHTAVPLPGSDGLQQRVSVEVRFFPNLPLTG